MDVADSKTTSFIIKIWIEETAEEADQARWRGHITHVGSSKRQYLETLDEISIFVAPYLKEMGVRFTPRRGLRRWFKHYMQCWSGKG